VLDDTYALCIARKQPLSVLLSLMEVFRSEIDYTVLMCLTDVSGFASFCYELVLLVVFVRELSMMLCFMISIMRVLSTLITWLITLSKLGYQYTMQVSYRILKVIGDAIPAAAKDLKHFVSNLLLPSAQ